MLGHSL
jgi:hypothetical protein